MDTNNQEVYEEQSAAPRRKKKKKKGWIIFLIILILAVAGGTGFYFMQRQKPISATEDFLENMRAMNFDGMKNLLQSNDMSALDNADITSDAYSSFFKKINEKMTYKIGKTNFHIQNGTASVTVHINYIDGADLRISVTDCFHSIFRHDFNRRRNTAETSFTSGGKVR